MAFYDALGTNDSAVMELGDEVLKAIARDLVTAVRNSVTIDWTVKETVRAKIRVMIKRILKKHHYPPDKQEQATLTVLQQAKVLCVDRHWKLNVLRSLTLHHQNSTIFSHSRPNVPIGPPGDTEEFSGQPTGKGQR